METKNQSHWWWFDSHNSPKCSPWLQSTLSELDGKTKAMLKLIEEDADSFAKRAEMYYKKRPELISMVEDFYRTHRSLAERYDLLRADPAVRVKSPLRHTISHFPSGLYEKALGSVKSFDSFTDETYHSDESVESEIDDPEPEDDAHVDQDGGEREKQFLGGATYDELMKLREELEQLREENDVQRNQIKQKSQENEELVTQISGNIDELRSLREEIGTIRRENANITLKTHTSSMMKLKDEIESLKVHLVNQRKELKQEEEEKMDVTRKLEEANYELMKLREEMQTENRQLNYALLQKDEEKREVIRQLSSAMDMLRQENQLLKKSIMKDTPKKRSSPEFQIFKGIGLRDLFSLSSKCQTSIIPL